MTVFSKLTSSLNYNCYEIAHPWTTSCSDFWSYLFASCIRESGKVYAGLYLLSQLLLARKISLEAFLHTFKSACRSTVFLSYNVFFFVFFICVFRKGTSRLFLQQSVFVSGLTSSFLSIFIEKPNRRKMLSLYMLNLFSEVLFNFLANRGMVPTIRYGDVLLFAIGLAGHTCLLNEVNGHDPISKALSYLIGKQEFRLVAPKECPHKSSCIHYTVSGFAKPFLIGYVGRCVLSALTGNLPRIIKNPRLLLTIFLNRSNMKNGVFFGGMAASFRLVQCLLRNRDVDDRTSRAISGFVASLWVATSRNKSLSLYVFWKTVETYYLLGQSKKLLPDVPYSREMIYAFSCGFMLFNAVLEPHNIRASYLRFLNTITGETLSKVNRHPVAVLGFNSTESWPEYFPYDMDLSKVSRGFLEQVIVWS